MKKLFSLALAAAMALSMLTGCGGNSNNTNNDTNSADTQGSQTSQTQQLSGVVNTNGSTSMEKVMQVLIEAFKEQQPNVTVNYTGSGSGAGSGSGRISTLSGKSFRPPSQAAAETAAASAKCHQAYRGASTAHAAHTAAAR